MTCTVLKLQCYRYLCMYNIIVFLCKVCTQAPTCISIGIPYSLCRVHGCIYTPKQYGVLVIMNYVNFECGKIVQYYYMIGKYSHSMVQMKLSDHVSPCHTIATTLHTAIVNINLQFHLRGPCMFHILCTSKCQRCKFSFSYTAYNGIHAPEEHNYGGLCIIISKAHQSHCCLCSVRQLL